MQVINKVMFVLETGQWFSFEDIVSECSLPECQVESVIDFLTQFDFLQQDNDKHLFRLRPEMIDLIDRLKRKHYINCDIPAGANG